MTTGHSAFYPYRGMEIHLSTPWKLNLCFLYPPSEFFVIFFNDFEKRSAWKALLQSGSISFHKNPGTILNVLIY